MHSLVATILPALLGFMLLFAAWCDLRSRTIPDTLSLGIALLALPWWWATGVSLWPDLAIQLAVVAVVFLVFGGLFELGWMGGGDVKLLVALAFWLPPMAMFMLLCVMSLAGGVLSLGMGIAHWIRKAQGQPEVPYGVAIALGGLIIFAQRYLNHFA